MPVLGPLSAGHRLWPRLSRKNSALAGRPVPPLPRRRRPESQPIPSIPPNHSADNRKRPAGRGRTGLLKRVNGPHSVHPSTPNLTTGCAIINQRVILKIHNRKCPQNATAHPGEVSGSKEIGDDGEFPAPVTRDNRRTFPVSASQHTIAHVHTSPRVPSRDFRP